MSAKPGPSILFVYFTYTKQTLKVVEAMSEVFERRGCDVHRAVIAVLARERSIRHTVAAGERPVPRSAGLDRAYSGDDPTGAGA